MLAVLLAGSLAAGCGGTAAGADSWPPPASLGVTMDTPVPATVLNAPLTAPDGRSTTLAAFKGETVVLTDFLTLCTDKCPMTSANFTRMSRAAQVSGIASRGALVEVSVDPDRDTPARLAAYRQLFTPAPPDWYVLTGPPSSIAAIWRYFGAHYQRKAAGTPPGTDWWTHQPLTYDVEHSDVVIYLDGRAHERFVINAAPDARTNQPPPTLARMLDEQGRSNLRSPDPTDSWTVAQGLQPLSWPTGHPIKTG